MTKYDFFFTYKEFECVRPLIPLKSKLVCANVHANVFQTGVASVIISRDHVTVLKASQTDGM